MDMCTIMEFHNAMLHPAECLNKMRDICFDAETLTRTKYFAECRGEIHGSEVMIYAPITTESLAMVRQANAILPTKSKHINRVQIIKDEMLCFGLGSHVCSLLVEPLPKGTLLSEAMYTHRCDNLLRGLEELHAELLRHDISINHLNTNSIIIDKTLQWHVIRPYYATQGAGGDEATIERLKELIMQNALTDIVEGNSSLCESYAPYGTYIDGDRTLYPASEGMRRFTTSSGTGFEDEQGNIVIEAKFLTATDFIEDRAVVESHNHKWGIVDRSGIFIIDMLYDSLDFDVDDGTSRASLNGLTATFDYFGTQLTPWE